MSQIPRKPDGYIVILDIDPALKKTAFPSQVCLKSNEITNPSVIEHLNYLALEFCPWN